MSDGFEKPFLRARRTLRHLWHIKRGDKVFNPDECDGCREIRNFLTDPTYRGDEHYPVGVEPYALGIENDPEDALGPNWKLEPDEMEPARETVALRKTLRIL